MYCEISEAAKKTSGKMQRVAGTLVGSSGLKDKGLMKEQEVESRKQAWKKGQATENFSER